MGGFEIYMEKAIQLAKKGLGRVNPNPAVGAVIVKNEKIVSEGWHQYYGGPHAERIAIEKALRKGIDLNGAVLFVTLEPCDHFGKTPPCTDLIIKSGIKKVVVGMKDPNPFSGEGLNKLKKHGIEVHTGILEEKIRKLNEFFLKYVLKKKPFVALKYAATLDGKIADENGNSKWITNKLRKKVQYFRNIYSAVLVGAGTVLKDDPKLTCRIENGRNPVRVILDREGILAKRKLNVFANDTKVLVFTESDKKYPGSVKVYRATSQEDILKQLYIEEIDSVLIEGGSKIFSQFLNYADAIYAFYSTKIFGKGLDIFSDAAFHVDDSSKFKIVDYQVEDTEIFLELRACSQE